MLQSMKIKGTFLSAYGVALLLSSVLAGWGYLSINRITELGEVENAFNKISNTTLEMRRSEKDFLLRDIKNEEFMESGKSKYVSDMDKLVATQDSIITSLVESKWAAKLNIHEDLTNLKNNIKAYHSTFHKITDAYRKRGFKEFGDEGELRVAIRALEESGYKIDMVQLLTLRTIEKDFFIHKDLRYVEMFTTAITSFLDKVDNGGKGQEAKIKIVTYEEKFNKLVKAEEIIGLNENLGLVGEMRNNIYKINPIVNELERLINVRSQKIISQATLISTIVFLIELIIGSVLINKFSKSLSLNLQYLRKKTSKISEAIIPGHLEIKTQRRAG
jgi:methyl-accepting chemotaxis protein